MPKKISIPCPYQKICDSPDSQIKKDVFIADVCKRLNHKVCSRKIDWDKHFMDLPEGERNIDFTLLTEKHLLRQIETFVRGNWRTYLTDAVLSLIHQKPSVMAVKTFCEAHKREWVARDILKMIDDRGLK
ncbi:MAG: hypothetical protein ACFFG0_11530 [Candidatus Thorarchaeota archaeon]